MKKTLPLLLAPLAFGLAACDGTTDDPAGKEAGRCEATEYLAFDPVNHAPQDARLDAIDQMLALFAEASTDPSTAAAKAKQIRDLYESPTTKLAAKIEGRKDVHHPEAPLGAEMTATIEDALSRLEGATTATEVAIAKQRFEKGGMYRFLFHSVLEELWAPTRQHYDEAYGYLGSGETNAPGARRSLARLATQRDATNGTTLGEELFTHLLDGACALETALDARGADEMNVDDDPAYFAAAQAIDRKMRLAVAASVGHEVYEIGKAGADVDGARIELHEVDAFFSILERSMSSGTDAEKALAADLRTAVDEAMANEDASWIAAFPADDLLRAIESTFGITVKG